MNDSLVFELVWHVQVHPSYLRYKKRCADQLHRIVCDAAGGTAHQQDVHGMMEVLEHVSASILGRFGFATRWVTRERNDAYYPLHVQALDLAS